VKNDVLVLGLGNPLMSDDGIGGFVLEKLAARPEQFPDIDFLDAGTAGMAVLHHIAGRKKVVLIDCAIMGTEPGTIKRFTPEQVDSVKQLAHFSMHEMDMLKVIEISKSLGECPEQIVFFGIEPESTAQGNEVTPTLKTHTDHFLEVIVEELTG